MTGYMTPMERQDAECNAKALPVAALRNRIESTRVHRSLKPEWTREMINIYRAELATR